jgi:hypothetical protein
MIHVNNVLTYVNMLFAVMHSVFAVVIVSSYCQ